MSEMAGGMASSGFLQSVEVPGPGPEPRKAGEIERETGRLHERTVTLLSRVNALEKRLNSVLTPEPASNPNGAGTATVSTTTPLGQALSLASLSVAEANLRIDRLIARLGL